MFVSTILALQIFLYNNATADQLIRAAMAANYNLQFAESQRLTHELQQRYPDHPVGYLLEAEADWWQAQADPTNKEIEKAYYAAQKSAVEHGSQALKENKYARVELLSYLASSYGSLARFQVTRKSAYFSALRAGMKALRNAREVYAIDPDYYDVYTGLGAYNYFTATMPGPIKPFAFLIGVHGDKELGLQQLRQAMEKSRHSRTEAKIVYYSALLQENRYADAFRLLEDLMKEFPDNFIFYHWTRSLFEVQHQTDAGIRYLDALAGRQMDRAPTLSKHALLEEASLEHTAGRDNEAKQTLNRIQSIPGNDRLVQSQMTELEKKLN
jgi:tetratricopeptide (TPR) repeat protein